MKQPFRFHRGEFNGFFLLRLAVFLNNAIGDILDELVYWAKMQFKLETEVNSEELAIRNSDITGLGKFAGVFPFYFAGGVWPGMISFTESRIVDGKQRSERGLYNQTTESFDYVRTANDDYPDDITTEASANRRSTLVPTGRTVLGYTRADEELYDVNGDVIWAHVYATPPVGVAYDVFYGEDFLTMSSDANVISLLPINVVKMLIELMQQIRYNGPSLKAFFDLTQALCEGFVKDITIVYDTKHYAVTYSLDNDAELDNRIIRYTVWQYVVRMKFKLFEISEVI